MKFLRQNNSALGLCLGALGVWFQEWKDVQERSAEKIKGGAEKVKGGAKDTELEKTAYTSASLRLQDEESTTSLISFILTGSPFLHSSPLHFHKAYEDRIGTKVQPTEEEDDKGTKGIC